MLEDAQNKLMNLINSTEGKVDKWVFVFPHYILFVNVNSLIWEPAQVHKNKTELIFKWSLNIIHY